MFAGKLCLSIEYQNKLFLFGMNISVCLCSFDLIFYGWMKNKSLGQVKSSVKAC